MNPSIELILAEFGGGRSNAGDSSLPAERYEPSVSSFLRHFPDAQVTMYTDQPWQHEKIKIVQVGKTPFPPGGRYGWRCNDYYQGIGLLASHADFAIAVDSDLLIVNDGVKALIPLARKFGLCMPVNGRHIVRRDARSDSDGGTITDETDGFGMCHATALWAFNTKFTEYRALIERYCQEVEIGAKTNGARGPIALWRAVWKTGFSPYTLPVQWCVTASNMGLGNEVILHVGHEGVAKHYAGLIEQWK